MTGKIKGKISVILIFSIILTFFAFFSVVAYGNELESPSSESSSQETSSEDEQVYSEDELLISPEVSGVTENIVLEVPKSSNINLMDIEFSMRKVGDMKYQKLNAMYNGSESDIVATFMIEQDIEYEYVINYITKVNGTRNIFKSKDTIKLESDGTVVTTDTNTTVKQEVDKTIISLKNSPVSKRNINKTVNIYKCIRHVSRT